jgi:hypothetical protein
MFGVPARQASDYTPGRTRRDHARRRTTAPRVGGPVRAVLRPAHQRLLDIGLGGVRVILLAHPADYSPPPPRAGHLQK